MPCSRSLTAKYTALRLSGRAQQSAHWQGETQRIICKVRRSAARARHNRLLIRSAVVLSITFLTAQGSALCGTDITYPLPTLDELTHRPTSVCALCCARVLIRSAVHFQPLSVVTAVTFCGWVVEPYQPALPTSLIACTLFFRANIFV